MRSLPICTQDEKLSPDKSWLLGLLAGDGCIRIQPDGTAEVGIALGADRALARAAAALIRQLYGVPVSVKWTPPKGDDAQSGGCWVVHCHRKRVAMDVLSYASFGIHAWTVPREVVRGPVTVRGAWASGFFDADGCVLFEPSKSTRVVSAGSANQKGRDALLSLLVGLGIESAWPHEWDHEGRHAYGVKITCREGLERFQEVVGFRCPRKAKLLRRALASYKRRTYLRTKEITAPGGLLERVVKLRAAGWFYKEIAAKEGLTYEQVRNVVKQRGMAGTRHGAPGPRKDRSFVDMSDMR